MAVMAKIYPFELRIFEITLFLNYFTNNLGKYETKLFKKNQNIFYCFLLSASGCLETVVNFITHCVTLKIIFVGLLRGQVKLDV